MMRILKLANLLLLSCFVVQISELRAQSKVTLSKNEAGFQLVRNGQPFSVKGVGCEGCFDNLPDAGGNSIRTWASQNLGEVLDKAHKHGLTVCAGLWMGHQRHGFDYQNQEAVLQQLDEKLAIVRKHKDHPALLLWGVGNEMEGEGRDPSVWYAVNHLAREIKRIDPNHPTMTVIAELGASESKVESIERFCPDVDIVGINAYGGIESVGKRFREAGGTKPYIVTEHGPLGPWEVGKTSWGSPLEWTSTEKAAWYAKGYRLNAVANADLCLGTYAFLWGHKQETSATWFGMLLPDGTKLGAVDSLSRMWTGKALENLCPEITKLHVSRGTTIKPGGSFEATVSASDPEDDKLRYVWVLRSDAGTIGEGGDPQEQESQFKNAVRGTGSKVTVTMPEGGGGYRLFAYVYDDQGGAAVANVSVRVNAPIELKQEMAASKLPYAVYGESEQSVFIPSGYMGNAEAITMDLNCSEDPYSGKTCLKASYKAGASWGGVLWQSPAEDWDGKLPGGANLMGATHLEFWARGDVGGETVNFVFGVLDGNQPYRDTAKGEMKDVVLTEKWKLYRLPLESLDLRQIKTGFGWSLAGQGKPVTFYLDNIRYVTD